MLYVRLDSLAADLATRRSVLGTSGVVRFLTGGNASWLLLKAADSKIIAGGQQRLADRMTLGLTTGDIRLEDDGGVPKGLESIMEGKDIRDPLTWLEWPARAFVAALALALAVVGVASIVAVIRLAIY